MGILAIAWLLTAAAPTVEVRSSDGLSTAGTIVELDAQHLLLERPGGPVRWATDKLAGIVVQSSKVGQAARPPIAVELVDGSTLAAEGIAAHQDRIEILLPERRRVEIPAGDIKSIRFGPLTESTAPVWSEMLKEATASDILVVKKGESIDYHKGVIGPLSAETIEFQLDGERLPVKRAKVFGLVYRRPPRREVAEPVGRLTERNGSAWAIASVALVGGNLRWTTPLGATWTRPLESIAQIDFSRGQAAYLSDLTPEAVQWTPYFSSGKQLPAQVALFAPRRNSSLESGPLQVDGKRYSKGLAVHSRTTLIYRLPDRYRRLSAVVGIDDLVRPRGDVRLVIRGDERVLVEMKVRGVDPARRIDVDLTGAHRLTIVADFGEFGDVGDHLDLCDARLVK